MFRLGFVHFISTWIPSSSSSLTGMCSTESLRCPAMYISLSWNSKYVELDLGNLSRAVSICQEPPKKKLRIFGALVFFCHPFLRLKGMSRKIQRKIFLRTYFALIWTRMVKLTYRFHQIATFLLVLQNTPIMAIFGAIMALRPFDVTMALWPYSHMAIMASNVDNTGVAGNSNKNVAIWWKQ